MTFETLITILTIENLTIHDNLCYLTIKSDIGQHSQFLRCLFERPELRYELRLFYLVKASRVSLDLITVVLIDA